VRFNRAIEAETLNRLVLRRMLPQIVLDAFPQIMRQKLRFSLEEKHKESAPLLNQSTSQKVNINLKQKIYCGGIVYHYLHQNQPSNIIQEKLTAKIVTKSKGNQKY
jgi:hypothetical protein